MPPGCRITRWDGQRASWRCGARFSQTADPNVVMLKGRWIARAIFPFICPPPPSFSNSHPLFVSLSIRSIPMDEHGTGRAVERSDIISVGHIPAEGGGSEGTGKGEEGEE